MTHEKTISDLAYHLWRARGCPNGSAEVDWAEAERQVRGTSPAAVGEATAAPPDDRSAAPEAGATRTKKKAKR